MANTARRLVAAAALVSAALVLSACGGGGGGGGAVKTMEIDMAAENGSGQSGTAELTASGDGTNITISTIVPADGTFPSQPAHVHKGTCDKLDPKPAYPLPNLEDGISATTLDVSYDELTKGGYVINVHKSAKEADVYVSCGEIAG